MEGDTVQLILPASLVGGAIALGIREVGVRFWEGRNGNVKLTKEEHAAICDAQYKRIEASIGRIHERLDNILEIMLEKK